MAVVARVAGAGASTAHAGGGARLEPGRSRWLGGVPRASLRRSGCHELPSEKDQCKEIRLAARSDRTLRLAVVPVDQVRSDDTHHLE
ncbi:MAG: hypothetical protein M0Z82_03680 [Actinomycetota bacterium]|nr:hypothetical protein [Actinomycetota bacterium]